MTLAGLAPTTGTGAAAGTGQVRALGAVDLVTVRTGDRAGSRRLRRPGRATSPMPSARSCAGSAGGARHGDAGVRQGRYPRRTISALAGLPDVDLAAIAGGRCEDGLPWLLRLLGTHVLIAGATGSGKGSVIWSAVRALLPGDARRLGHVWALDPKRMELSFGRGLFDRYADQARRRWWNCSKRPSARCTTGPLNSAAGPAPSPPRRTFPFLVILIDELAFLTAYQPERDLRKRAEAAIATLTSQGRSVGVCVVGALQDPRKDVISLRNLFPTRVALRLDESDQVDMVLGDGARDRGALADQISPLPATGAGVGYVRLEGSPDPVRVRAAYVTDEDIHAMAAAVTSYRLWRRWAGMTAPTVWHTDEPCPSALPGWS